MTRSARSAWNFLTTVAFSAISMIVALGVTPLVLRELGPARFGAARAAMDWAGYLVLLELGLNGALRPLLGRALAREDPAEVRAVMSAGFRAYVFVTLAMVVGGLLLALLITRLVTIDPVFHHDLRWAALFAAAPVLLMPLSPLRALSEASQRAYVQSVFLIIQSVATAIAAVYLARSGWGITGQTLAVSLGALLFGLLVVADARRSARDLLPSNLLRAEPERTRDIWQLNAPTLIMNICGRVGLLTDNIVVGWILGAPMIVPFLMTQRLGQIAQAQLQSVGTASWAGLAQLHARGEHDLFRARFLELNQLVTVLGLAVLMPIVAFNHVFVRLWLGERSYAGGTLTAIAASNALVLSVASLWGWLFGGTGQVARLVPLSLASVTVNLSVSLGVTWLMAGRDPHRALWGPVLGTSAALLLVNLPFTPPMLRRHFDIPVWPLLKALGAPLVVAAPCCVALLWFAAKYPPGGWFALASDMSVAGLVFAAICWLLVLNSEARGRWVHRLRLAIGR